MPPVPKPSKGQAAAGFILTTVGGLVLHKGVGWYDSRKQALNDVESSGTTLVGVCRDWLISYERESAVAGHNNAHSAFVVAAGRAQVGRRRRRKDLLRALVDDAAVMMRAVNRVDKGADDVRLREARQAIDEFQAQLTELRARWQRQVTENSQPSAEDEDHHRDAG